MTIVAPLQTNCTAGEFSPRMEGRVDYAKFPNSARILENFVPTVQGPFLKVPGRRMIAAQKYDAWPARPIEFEYSTAQAYVLECGAAGSSGGYIRIFRERGQLAVAETDAAIANGGFDSDISDWDDKSGAGGSIAHDSGGGGRLALQGGGGTAAAEQDVTTTDTGQEHVIAFRVIGSHYDKVTVAVGSSSGASDYLSFEAATGWHALAFTPAASPFYVRFTNAAGKTLHIDDVALVEGAFEIGAPFTSDRLAEIKFAQSADVLFLQWRTHWTVRLERRGQTTWSLVHMPYKDGPYLEENTESGHTLQPSAATGKGVTLTASGFSPFAATDVGRLVRLKHSSTWGWGVIVGYTSATQVTIDVREDFGATTATAEWRLGLFSDTDGHPAAVNLFQQRLMVTGAGARSSRIDGSSSSDFETFTPGTEDDDAVSYLISDGGVNSGQWIAALGNMVIGTKGGEFRAMGDTQDGPLTPTAVRVRGETRTGLADKQPLQLSNVILALRRHARTVHAAAYSFEQDGLVGRNLTREADHVTESGVCDWTWQQEPFDTAWMCRNDGELIGLVFAPQDEVVGWFRCPGRHGLDAVEGVACIPGARQDDVYMTCKRTIDGQVKRFVEVMEDRPYPEDDPQVKHFYLNCGLTSDNCPEATLTPGATSGASVTFTSSSGVFAASDVGQFIRYRYRARNALGKRPAVTWKTAKAEIKSFVSATEVTADILDGFAFPSTDAIAAGEWRVTRSAVAGADHLAGETVQLVGDGAYMGEVTVPQNGEITLPTAAACVHLGLGYDAVYLNPRVEGGSREGSMQGKPQRVFEVLLRLYDTSAIKIGRAGGKLEAVTFRTYEDPMDEPLETFTDDRVERFNGTSESEGDVLVVADLPLHCEVVALGTRRVVHDG